MLFRSGTEIPVRAFVTPGDHDVIYLSADQEEIYRVAQANSELDHLNQFVADRVEARLGENYIQESPESVEFMDVSPMQIMSVYAALIPFLEHDDANRALMGSNMQRQDVPLLRPQAPMFLHFGELHLIFNMLWLWYFGRQLEAIHPRWLFVMLIVLTSFVSNTTQYLSSNFNNFGGMSGVVYGLVGYTWLVHTLMPRSRLQIRGSMFAVFVAALLLMEILASSWIATAAHIGGLVSGLLLGLGGAGFYRGVLKRDHISRSPSS